MNTNEVGQIVDMIKDLSEAEEKCWKACYYKSVVENMNQSSSSNQSRMMSYEQQQPMMMPNQSDYSSMMSNASLNQHSSDNGMSGLKSMLQSADPAKNNNSCEKWNP